MNKGKKIFQLGEKVEIIAKVLHENNILESSNITTLARHIGVKHRTLQSSMEKESISVSLETALAQGSGFRVESHFWKDSDQPTGNRTGFTDYKGKDTAKNFEQYFRQIIREKSSKLKFTDRYCLKLPNLPFHCITGSLQVSNENNEIPFILELDATEAYSDDGIKFGFSCLRLSVDCVNQLEITGRLGEAEPSPIASYSIIAKGTRLTPYWEISSDDKMQAVLGTITTSELPPLMWASKLCFESEIKSTLSANIYESIVFSEEDDAALTNNKKQIIVGLLAKELAQGHSNGGWIEFCQHSLLICEDQK